MPEMHPKINSATVDVAALKKRLPPGWISLINAKLDNQYSKTTISLVLKGERRNIEIIEKAIEVAEEYAERQAELNNRINSI